MITATGDRSSVGAHDPPDPRPPPGTGTSPGAPLGARRDPTPAAGLGRRPPLPAVSRIALVCGLLVAALGAVEMSAWQWHLTTLLRVRSGYVPITFNAALALALTGAAIAAAAMGRVRWMRAAGAFDVALGVAVLAEQALSWDLRIDQLLMRAYFGPAAAPGRPAVNTACAFVMIGAALLLWRPGAERLRRWAPAGAGAFAGSIALVALFGYVANIPTAYGWFHAVAMSVPTALALVILANGLLALGWQGNHRREGLPEWVAIPAGLTAFCFTAVVWIAFVDLKYADRTIAAGKASQAAAAVALLAAGLLAATAALGQRAASRRRLAERLAADLRAEVALRTAAETAARESEQLLFRFLEALPVGLFVARPGGRPYYVNQVAERLLGRGVVAEASVDTLADVYGTFVAGTAIPYPTEGMPVVRALAGEASYIDDIEIRGPARSVPVEVWGSPVTDSVGTVQFGVAAFVDIAGRRAAEARLAEQAALLDAAPDAIMVRDAEYRLTYWNCGAEQTFGWGRAESLGRVSYELLRTEFPEPVEDIERTLALCGRWDGELVQQTRDGRRVTMASRWVARYDGDGAVSSVMAINTDISERKAAADLLARQSADLTRLNADLRRSNEELEQFAYVASHDLSEPLRAISGPVSLLARRYRGALDPDADQLIAFAVDGCDRMQTLITDLLALSRAGRVDADPVAVDLNETLRTALLALGPAIGAQGTVVTSDPLPVVLGQPGQLGQVVQNLVANAVKFSDPDRAPRLHVSAERSASECRVTLTDNGIGVEARHRERIFGMFKRLHTRDAYPGTGIGLALCKKIVERHGGAIGVDSAPDGAGSSFWFTLPVSEENTP